MRIRVLLASAALSVAAVPAFAADFGNYQAAPAPAYSAAPAMRDWSGLEIGALLGYSFGNSDMHPRGRSSIHNDGASGVDGGVYAGYNIQQNNFVAGVEGDIVGSGAHGRDAGFKAEQNWEATLRGKVGYSLNQFLLYGTGGAALGNLKVAHDGTDDDHTAWGWTAGVGGEAMLTNRITARVEYRYTDYENKNFDIAPRTKADLSNNSIRAGVGYKF
ncbi:outer membrane immunogenic protein [Faunimonas pinastri]|uniref:Outer membrane immunogenic protein n=1 Tax=Faunimonas pinastri TaxID=1855383 RepID=A0A1H9AUQ1_9HYPH|nr:outer membrane protein [Faunimonas pinastri]SEP80217.1 outer membrane immunogenic protein [Faunimonas pinastri]